MEDVPKFKTIEEEMEYYKQQQRAISDKRAAEREKFDSELKKTTTKKWMLYKRSNAISIHKCIADYLVARGDWGETANGNQRCDMWLAGWCSKGVDWGAMGSSGSNKLLLNYYRGYNALCFKEQCVMNIQTYCKKTGIDYKNLMPESYVFMFGDAEKQKHPGRMDQEALIAAYKRVSVDDSASRNAWIVKPGQLQCGTGIEIHDKLDKLLACLDRQKGKGHPFVVQKYIERPLLCKGGRKFDIRLWVLLSTDYKIGIYPEGVLRTTAVKYSMDDLSDPFAHLSNHCIAIKHGNYGEFEATNEMWFQDFDAWLIEKYGAKKSFWKTIFPRMGEIVVQTLLSVKEQIENSDTASFSCFHLFGYDFMVDEQFDTKLLEINSSPAVAADLMPNMTEDIVAFTIDNVYEPSADAKALHATKLAELSKHAADATAKYLNEAQTQKANKLKEADSASAASTPAASATVAPSSTPVKSKSASWKFRRGFQVFRDRVFWPLPKDVKKP